MKTKSNVPQLTIRNLPQPVSDYLRKRAAVTGQSLNQTIINELSERAGVTRAGKPQTMLESLSWFIGSGIDQETLDVLAEDHREQKALARREERKLKKLGL